MRFVLRKVALWHVFGISEPVMTPVMLHLLSEAGITGSLEDTVSRDSVPSTLVTKTNMHFKNIQINAEKQLTFLFCVRDILGSSIRSVDYAK